MNPNRDIQILKKDAAARLSGRLCLTPGKEDVQATKHPAQNRFDRHGRPHGVQSLERNKKKTMESPPGIPYNPHK